jgi:hypothetical protein
MTVKKKTVKSKETAERPVVICTQYRGVFFGYATNTSGGTVTLKRARMCVYWDQSMHGVLGLASVGPSSGCRVGQAADSIELRGVTAVVEVTPEAVAKWEAAPWS